MARAKRVLASLDDELRGSDWFTDTWLEDAVNQACQRFDAACNRWRGLYRSAMAQRDLQNRIIGDASRQVDRQGPGQNAPSRGRVAARPAHRGDQHRAGRFLQLSLFRQRRFPAGLQLPPPAAVGLHPGAAAQQTRDEFVSRPRFLAISEFGPRSILYHEGSRYQINRVILPVEESERLPTEQIKLCPQCGYLASHAGRRRPRLLRPVRGAARPRAPVALPAPKRFDQAPREDQLRRGGTSPPRIRDPDRGALRRARRPPIVPNRRRRSTTGPEIATLAYGQAATLWRINLGENRRKVKEQRGFVLDIERGYWARSEQAAADEGDEPDPMTPRTARVIPYVEDRRNALLLEFQEPYETAVIASLQAALKNAIQVRYQLEDGELAIEPLPTRDKRRLILIYESAEGGAGVLRRLVEDPDALPRRRQGSAADLPFRPRDRAMIAAAETRPAKTARPPVTIA